MKDDPTWGFHPATRAWLAETFAGPTEAQARAWPLLRAGRSTVVLSPTGSGKTLAAFLVAIDRALFRASDAPRRSVLYVSPLKALAVDVERNLRAPLAGIQRCAARERIATADVVVAIRTGDTDSKERARQTRRPPDVLITTPESLYLLLTSNAREALLDVDTVIVDEIHAILPTKRGAHLALSLERLEALRCARHPGCPPLQRIGLSATQRPVEEVARLLGGFEVGPDDRARPRPVEIVDARASRPIEIAVEVPVEDMTRLADRAGAASGNESSSLLPRSIWPSIHPRLVELIRAHRSTMIFVNARRLAERLAADLNELAGEEIALAHHGSLARERRELVEDRLKRGEVRAIVATSSLELGLDIGAVDLVVQIEAPPSIASGLQRIGRASHHVGGTPRGIVFPKHRADLLAIVALVPRMLAGDVESTSYPRHPLDVLAQQIVAMVAMDEWTVDDLFARIRSAAPFASLGRENFEAVLDMLSGRYPSDAFAELQPRITWDRVAGTLRARVGAKRLAVLNAGVIPDRGLYGVYLFDETEGRARSGRREPSRRIGELDEEMVFECREGDVFLLGASSWRVAEITRDRVLVVPAPGEPGKMPFWRGDRVGRSAEAGAAIGELAREIARLDEASARHWLERERGLESRVADNLARYVHEQIAAVGVVPCDRALVIERFRDELGDHRICILSPWGSRVHAPLATAIAARARDELNVETEAVWTDDGIVLRFPETDEPPDIVRLIPRADEIEAVVVAGLAATSLFSARFRECAGRALLLPRKAAGRRQPLWALRKRARDLLAIVAQFPSFPIVLEAYRECLREAFDLEALRALLSDVERGGIRVHVVDTTVPSPFAASVLFSYVGTFIYETDAPFAERRAQTLALDHRLLRDLVGAVDLSELLSPDAIESVAARVGGYGSRLEHEDALHDLLLRVGDLETDEIVSRARRSEGESPTELVRCIDAMLQVLERARRLVRVRIVGRERWIAVEDASRYRDALGCVLPPGLPASLLTPTATPTEDLVARFARTRGPFRVGDVAQRFGLGPDVVRAVLEALERRGKVVRGWFVADSVRTTDGRDDREQWCDVDVLRQVKHRSLADWRREVEPVPPVAYARFLARWHGVDPTSACAAGEAALVSAIARLEGLPLPFEALERDILPARVEGFRPSDLDVLIASGEVLWRGVDGGAGGRIALYFADRWPLLAGPAAEPAEGLEATIFALLADRGAILFRDIIRAVPGRFEPDVVEALWSLVWKGLVTNDTLVPLRSRLAPERSRRRASSRFAHRSRTPPGTEGRWSALPSERTSETDRRFAWARLVLERHGIFVRESSAIECDEGVFGVLYAVLRTMEDAGRIRRGWFVEGLGATQFAARGAEDLLRSLRDAQPQASAIVLAATDPAQPYGAALAWPERTQGARPARASGALVVLHEGRLVGWLGRTEQSLLTFLPTDEPDRTRALVALADALTALVRRSARRALFLSTIDGEAPMRSPLARLLVERGFRSGSRGLLLVAGATQKDAHTPERVESDAAPGWDDDDLLRD